MAPAGDDGAVHRDRRDVHARGRPDRQPGPAHLPGVDLGDLRRDLGVAADRVHAVSPAQPLRRGQALRPSDGRDVPRALRHARLQRDPLQPRVAAAAGGVRHAQGHPRRGGDQARARGRAARRQPRRDARLELRGRRRRGDAPHAAAAQGRRLRRLQRHLALGTRSRARGVRGGRGRRRRPLRRRRSRVRPARRSGGAARRSEQGARRARLGAADLLRGDDRDDGRGGSARPERAARARRRRTVEPAVRHDHHGLAERRAHDRRDAAQRPRAGLRGRPGAHRRRRRFHRRHRADRPRGRTAISCPSPTAG